VFLRYIGATLRGRYDGEVRMSYESASLRTERLKVRRSRAVCHVGWSATTVRACPLQQ